MERILQKRVHVGDLNDAVEKPAPRAESRDCMERERIQAQLQFHGEVSDCKQMSFRNCDSSDEFLGFPEN